MKIKCYKCGVESEGRFCGNCGTNLMNIGKGLAISPEEVKAMYPQVKYPDKIKEALPAGYTLRDIQDIYKEVLRFKEDVTKKAPRDSESYFKLLHNANTMLDMLEKAYGKENIK